MQEIGHSFRVVDALRGKYASNPTQTGLNCRIKYGLLPLERFMSGFGVGIRVR
jgi:hypothetical protein